VTSEPHSTGQSAQEEGKDTNERTSALYGDEKLKKTKMHEWKYFSDGRTNPFILPKTPVA